MSQEQKNGFNEKKRLGKTTKFLISWTHKIVAPNVHLKLAGWRALIVLSNFYSMFILFDLKYQILHPKKENQVRCQLVVPFCSHASSQEKEAKGKKKRKQGDDKIKKDDNLILPPTMKKNWHIYYVYYM